MRVLRVGIFGHGGFDTFIDEVRLVHQCQRFWMFNPLDVQKELRTQPLDIICRGNILRVEELLQML